MKIDTRMRHTAREIQWNFSSLSSFVLRLFFEHHRIVIMLFWLCSVVRGRSKACFQLCTNIFENILRERKNTLFYPRNPSLSLLFTYLSTENMFTILYVTDKRANVYKKKKKRKISREINAWRPKFSCSYNQHKRVLLNISIEEKYEVTSHKHYGKSDQRGEREKKLKTCRHLPTRFKADTNGIN